jgi:hypothetical protein
LPGCVVRAQETLSEDGALLALGWVLA